MPKREEREKKNRKEVGGKTTPRGVQVLKNTLLDNKQPGWEGAAGSLWGGGGAGVLLCGDLWWPHPVMVTLC